MRGLLALGALLALAGCAEMKTLEELEMLAATTGDWSAVERRERRLARTAPRCPLGYLAICQTTGASRRCGCAAKSDLRAPW